MSYPIDQTFIREPQLYLPKRKPNYQVKVDWENPITKGLKHAFLYHNGIEDIIERDSVFSASDYQISVHNGQKVMETLNNTGHIEYKVKSWVQSTPRATFVYKVEPLGNVIQQKGGLNFWDEGISGSNFGIRLNSDDIHFAVDTGTLIRQVSVVSGLAADTVYDLAMTYDGTQSTAGDRVRGYVNGIEYTDTDSFPATADSSYDKLFVSAYGYGSNTVDYNSNSYHGYIWSRTLSIAELESIRHDPYQMFIPA